MAPVVIHLLAQAPANRGEQKQLLVEYWWLWTGLVLLGLLLIGVVGALASARRRALAAGGRGRRRRRAIKDAWAEAGKRAAPIDAEPEEAEPS